MRKESPVKDGPLAGLIEDLTAGHNASHGKGGGTGSNQHKKKDSSPVSVNGAAEVPPRTQSRSPGTLAARMIESTDSRVRAAWKDYLAGKHKTVTAAAIACGMAKFGHDPLVRLKQYWKKASAEARQEFLRWIEE